MRPKYFRTPFNLIESYRRSSDTRVLDLVNKEGLTLSEFDTDPQDWKESNDENYIFNFATQNIKSQLLLHDIDSNNKKDMLAALPRIIDNYKSKNLDLVRVDQIDNQKLDDEKKKNWFEM